MEIKRKLPWIITGKSLLAVGSIAMVALALVTYTATINISFNAFFVQGMASATWSMTTASGYRYLPGKDTTAGTVFPIAPTQTNTSSFAFYSQTGQGYIKVGTGTAASTSQFTSFKILALKWSGTAWNNYTIWTTSVFTAQVVGGIDGTNNANVGFLQVNSTSLSFYALQISYVLAGTPTGTPTVTFTYTPSLN